MGLDKSFIQIPRPRNGKTLFIKNISKEYLQVKKDLYKQIKDDATFERKPVLYKYAKDYRSVSIGGVKVGFNVKYNKSHYNKIKCENYTDKAIKLNDILKKHYELNMKNPKDIHEMISTITSFDKTAFNKLFIRKDHIWKINDGVDFKNGIFNSIDEYELNEISLFKEYIKRYFEKTFDGEYISNPKPTFLNDYNIPRSIKNYLLTEYTVKQLSNELSVRIVSDRFMLMYDSEKIVMNVLNAFKNVLSDYYNYNLNGDASERYYNFIHISINYFAAILQHLMKISNSFMNNFINLYMDCYYFNER